MSFLIRHEKEQEGESAVYIAKTLLKFIFTFLLFLMTFLHRYISISADKKVVIGFHYGIHYIETGYVIMLIAPFFLLTALALMLGVRRGEAPNSLTKFSIKFLNSKFQ